MKRLALIASTALLANPALALTEPQPCSAADPRVRCTAYSETEIVQLYAAQGASLTVEFAPSETIMDASPSDNGLIEGGMPSARQAVQVSAGASPTADRNLMMAKRGSFLFLKPLVPLVPQPITVLTKRADGTMRRYTFQLQTRDGALTPDSPNVFYVVRFTYPADAAAERRARAAEAAARREARIAAARLQQHKIDGPTVANDRYVGQATPEARAALAPAAPATGPAIWDDGQRTYLRFPANHRVPAIYQVLPDGREGVIGQSADPDPATGGTLVTVHGVVPALRLRDGRDVLCIINQGFNPTGRPTGTGTTDPSVVRELAPVQEHPRVR